jgi:hypothetical protein
MPLQPALAPMRRAPSPLPSTRPEAVCGRGVRRQRKRARGVGPLPAGLPHHAALWLDQRPTRPVQARWSVPPVFPVQPKSNGVGRALLGPRRKRRHGALALAAARAAARHGRRLQWRLERRRDGCGGGAWEGTESAAGAAAGRPVGRQQWELQLLQQQQQQQQQQQHGGGCEQAILAPKPTLPPRAVAALEHATQWPKTARHGSPTPPPPPSYRSSATFFRHRHWRRPPTPWIRCLRRGKSCPATRCCGRRLPAAPTSRCAPGRATWLFASGCCYPHLVRGS